eukprot:364615-Chlamydomonas_euryale.AAC.9
MRSGRFRLSCRLGILLWLQQTSPVWRHASSFACRVTTPPLSSGRKGRHSPTRISSSAPTTVSARFARLDANCVVWLELQLKRA